MSETLNTSVGARLRQIREGRNIKAADIARMVDVNPTVVWHWENFGVRPKDATIRRLSKKLGVPYTYLAFGDERRVRSPALTQTAGEVQNKEAGRLEQLVREIESLGFSVVIRSKQSPADRQIDLQSEAANTKTDKSALQSALSEADVEELTRAVEARGFKVERKKREDRL